MTGEPSRETPAHETAAAAASAPNGPARDEAIDERFFWIVLAVFAALGVAVRFGYIEIVDPPIRRISDASGYFHMGRNLAAGYGYISWTDLKFLRETTPTAVFPPLYPFLLSLLQRSGITSQEGQHLAVALLAAVNVPLIGMLGRAIGGRATGLVAAAMAMLSPALLEIDGSFMAEALYLPLVTLAFLALLRACRGRSARDWMLAGGVLGLAALARAEALLFLPVLALPLAWLTGGNRRVVLAFAAIAGLTLVVLPWTIRNAVQLGAFVPISQNYKGVIHGANCKPTYRNPELLGGWSFGCLSLPDGASGLSETEYSNRGRDIGLQYALEHREQLPRVLAARLLRTWGLYRPGTWYGSGEIEVRNPDFSRRTWFLGWLLLAMAPVGLALVGSRSPVRLAVALAPMLVVSATSVIGYGNPRFRAAAEPLLIVLAALCLTALYTAWQRHRSRTATG